MLCDIDALENSFRSIQQDFDQYILPTSISKQDINNNQFINEDIKSITSTIHSFPTSLQPTNAFATGNNVFLHCFAIKSCPLSYILHRAVTSGLGLECASIMEVKQAIRCGCPPEKVVFCSNRCSSNRGSVL